MSNLWDADILKMYNDGASLRETANHFNTSTSTVMRLVKKFGKLRDKGSAQKQALQSGKSVHPTKGKVRSNATKLKISHAQAKAWEEIDDVEYKQRQKQAQDRWNNMSDAQKHDMSKKAAKGIRKASDEGSKMELFLKEFLLQSGYNVIFHKKELVPNTKLEVDMLIPELNTVIEIDGPSHYLPVWGEESLQKTIKSDLEKNGLLLAYGFVVIRIRYDGNNFTLKSRTDITNLLTPVLDRIKTTNLNKDEKMIILEI